LDRLTQAWVIFLARLAREMQPTHPYWLWMGRPVCCLLSYSEPARVRFLLGGIDVKGF
jgi:hypothetical protein